jgi:hypothetical protein
MKEACCNSQVGKESPQKKEENMTTDSHEGSHKKRKKDAKEDGIKGMSQEDFDRELDELKERLSMIEKLLDEGEKDQWYGWILRKKKVRWNSLQVKLRIEYVCQVEEGTQSN